MIGSGARCTDVVYTAMSEAAADYLLFLLLSLEITPHYVTYDCVTRPVQGFPSGHLRVPEFAP